jgi:serine protease AprX
MLSQQDPEAEADERPAVRCPLCGQRAEPTLFARHPQMQDVVRDTLSLLHPGWRLADGACPNCVGRALEALTSSGHDLGRILLHAAAHTDNPLVAAAGDPALPIPERLHANPLFRGAGVVLGMLDSGFFPHPDLTEPRNRIRLAVDAMADPPIEGADFSRPAVRSWHGLMTSVVAAGNGYLSGGRYRGIASDADLVLARVGLPNMRIPDSAIADGLRWMLAHHRRLDIRVLNVSLGGDEELPAAESEVDRLAEELIADGVLVVAASGNTGERESLPPGSEPRVLTVGGATDQNVLQVHLDHFVRWRSSYGPTVDGVQKPEVVAPAMLLAAPLLPGTRQARDAANLAHLLTLDDATLDRKPQRDEARRALGLRAGTLDAVGPAEIRYLLAERMVRHNWLSAYYQFVDGTSVAAPIVASVAVQMVEANPHLTPARIKTLLTATAVPMHGVPTQMQGHGMVNPAGAVAAALRAPGGPLAGLPLSPQHGADGGFTFYYYNPQVARVAFVGDLNRWYAAGADFTRLAPGIFRLALPPLPPGRYLYKFLLDDTTAVPDPDNLARAPDGYGDFNSVLDVGA